MDRKKILAVDDDFDNVELLRIYLQLAGYQVTTARSGEEALQKVARDPPDLILLDIVMPGLDGYQVCAQLKEDKATQFIPIVMITALQEKEDRVKGIEAGADDFLSKPFDEHELMARVKSLLRIKGLHDEVEQKSELLFKIMNRYVTKEVSTLILDAPDRYLKLGGESRIVTVLFADIRGFTEFAGTHSAKRVVTVLNRFFSELTRVIFKYKGTFDKYIGDAVMAFYGAPVSYEDDVIRALQTALEMQQVFGQMKEKWQSEELTPLALGIGLNTGEAVVGNIGSEKVMDYTVIGDTVNVAKRLQEIADPNQILISQSTYQQVREQAIVEEIHPKLLKGKLEPIAIYELKGLLDDRPKRPQ
jgi:class 3 adenylate cyclase/ActR/RegA family two-component response regulator